MIRPTLNELINPLDEAYVLIGNGFDLECGLPTTYTDFLNFLSAIELFDDYFESTLVLAQDIFKHQIDKLMLQPIAIINKAGS